MNEQPQPEQPLKQQQQESSKVKSEIPEAFLEGLLGIKTTKPQIRYLNNGLSIDIRTVITLLLSIALAISCMLNWIIFQERDWLRQEKTATDERITSLIISERVLIENIVTKVTTAMDQVTRTAAEDVSRAYDIQSLNKGSGDHLIPLREVPIEK